MERRFYLELAASGLAMPLGTNLILHEKPDPQAILLDGARLGAVVIEAARRYGTPLAIPEMDLQVEKAAITAALGVPPAQADTFHFAEPPTPATVEGIVESLRRNPTPRMRANIEALRLVAAESDLVAVGMHIGPFSLATKLMADPITATYLAGMGADPAETPEVRLLESVLELATRVCEVYAEAQMHAGARVMVEAEPAANATYISPRQMAEGSDVYERIVMTPNRHLRARLRENGVDLVFHCCGELSDTMLRSLATLDPAMLSLGGSRRLWEDAAIVPKDVVLYGNLPSKRFYSDGLITRDAVIEQGRDLIERMRQAGHPFILGSECDVLHVAGCGAAIRSKVEGICECSRYAGATPAGERRHTHATVSSAAPTLE